MSNYFNRLPDFEYPSRLPDAKISDYIRVKNLFKKGTIREDIFQEVSFFTKYQIVGDDRPDNVANKVYGNPSLDWLVLQSNNMVFPITVIMLLDRRQFPNLYLCICAKV